MFKNLKKRVEQEGGENLLAAVASGAVSTVKSPLSSVRSLSRESLVSELGPGDRDRVTSVSSVPIPEETSIEDLQKKIARLQTALDRQQSGYDRRLKKNEEEVEERIKQVHAVWQAKYDVLKENMTAVLDKNARLEEEWPALEARAKEGDGYREKLIVLQDELDTMQSLQNQEIAKVKHLLIQKEKEFVDSEERCKELEQSLTIARKDADSLARDLEQLRNTQRSCSELQDKCDSLQFQLGSLEAARAQETGEHEAVVTELREKVASLEKRLAAAELGDDDRVHALTLERAVLEKKLEETREQLNNVKTTWSSKIDALERQISHLNASKAEESQENEKLASALNEAKDERDKLSSQVAELDEKLRDAETGRSDLQNRLVALEKSEELLASTRAELEAVKVDRGKLQNVLDVLSAQVKELEPFKVRAESAESQLSKMEQQLSSMKEMDAQLAAANNTIKRLQGEEEELSSKLKRREDRLAMVEEEMELLKSNEASAKKTSEELSEAKSKLAQLEAIVKDLTAMNARREETEKELDRTKQKLALMEKELTETKAECGEKTAAVAAAEARCLELEAVREQLLQTITETNEALEFARKAQEEAENNCKCAEDRLKALEVEKVSLCSRLADAENWTEEKVEKLDAMIKVRQTVELLEQQLVEKNKTIRLQNQRLNDMKKTLQKEINSKAAANVNGAKQMNSVGDSSSEESGNVNSNSVSVHTRCENMPPPTLAVTSPDDVNFTYMKNVVLHILTSKGSEALHMTKALATVLKLSTEEERLVRDTLEWRLSWFAPKPDLTKLL